MIKGNSKTLIFCTERLSYYNITLFPNRLSLWDKRTMAISRYNGAIRINHNSLYQSREAEDRHIKNNRLDNLYECAMLV